MGSPQNPTAIVKVDPYAKSAVVNEASMYLYVCSAVKNSPGVALMAFSSTPWSALLTCISITAHNTVACGMYITTDEVAHSFVVKVRATRC